MSYIVTLTLDAASDALASSLIPAVQAAYDTGAYPPLVIDAAYVRQNAVRVGLHYWIPPQFFQPSYPRGEPLTLPSIAKLTPTAIAGTASYSVAVPQLDVDYANSIIAAIGGASLVDVLGCALCTGLVMMNGFLPLQVGPWTAAP